MVRLLSARARPLRFLVTGGTTAAVQLALLAALTHRGWSDLPANAAAFLLAAQLNFILSWQFTWRDRHVTRAGSRLPVTIAASWAAFHVSIAGTAALNQGVFLLARSALPALAASALGIATGATGNYLLGDRLIFRAPAMPCTGTSAMRSATCCMQAPTRRGSVCPRVTSPQHRHKSQ